MFGIQTFCSWELPRVLKKIGINPSPLGIFLINTLLGFLSLSFFPMTSTYNMEIIQFLSTPHLIVQIFFVWK
jgi:hypothetical protein